MNDPVRLLCLLTEELGEVAAEIKKTWSDNYPDLVIDDLAANGDIETTYQFRKGGFDGELKTLNPVSHQTLFEPIRT